MTNDFDDFFGLSHTEKEKISTAFDEAKPKLDDTLASKVTVYGTPGELKPINRYGKCPNPECGEEWDMGNILANLTRISAFDYKTEEEIVNIAAHGFGYEVKNPKNFSKVIAIQIIEDTIHASEDVNPNRNVVDPHFYMCPKCRQVWDAATGQQYGSIVQAKRLKGFYNERDSKELDSPLEE